jgi:hypothetical protein|tara:strand:+ start:1445 stop:1579 length:135 start_codon:yes stop_codon:yes gene_type:complete
MFAKSHSLIRYGITHLQEVLVVLIMRAKKPENEKNEKEVQQKAK